MSRLKDKKKWETKPGEHFDFSLFLPKVFRVGKCACFFNTAMIFPTKKNKKKWKCSPGFFSPFSLFLLSHIKISCTCKFFPNFFYCTWLLFFFFFGISLKKTLWSRNPTCMHLMYFSFFEIRKSANVPRVLFARFSYFLKQSFFAYKLYEATKQHKF